MDDVKVVDDISNLNIQVLKKYSIQVSSDNIIWEKYSLFITSSNFILWKHDLKITHFWKTISRFQYHEYKIYINFGDTDYIIQSSDISNLISDLCEIIQRVLLPSELSRIDFSVIDCPQIGPGTESADSRFMMQQTCNLHTATSNKEITTLVKYGIPQFRISNASEMSFLLPTYLDILPFIKTLKIVELPIIGVDHMKIISNFPQELRYTRKIEINGIVNPILYTFLERIRETQNQSKLTSLSFSLSNFNRNDLSTISNAIIKGPINSIEFHRSFHPSSVQYFYSTFLSHQMNGMIWILNLDKTTGLDLNKLFPKIRKVPFVSLAHCELDIIEALTVASESKMEKLSILNLSGNNAVSSSIEKVKKIKKIPSLKKLIFEDVTWPNNFLTQLLTTVFDRFRNNLSLSFSKAKASQDEWNEVFDFFENCEYDGLIGLSWCSNPIHLNLLHFLKRNDQLRQLDFDNCIDDRYQELVGELTSLLKSSVNLRNLSIAGSKEKHIGTQITSIIEACTGHENLHEVNFPFSFGSYDALPAIMQLIDSTPSLKVVNFEGLGLTNHNSFIGAMMKLSKSREGLKVNFPLEDLKGFKGIMSKDDEIDLKNAYRHSYRDQQDEDDPSAYNVKPPSEPFLNKKRVLYRHTKKDTFPAYITDRTIERLKEELVDIPEKIADKKTNSFSKSMSYVEKKPAGPIQFEKAISKSLINSFTLPQKTAKTKTKSDPYDIEVEEEEEGSLNSQTEKKAQLYSSDDSLNNSQTESEHPFQPPRDYISYSEGLDKKLLQADDQKIKRQNSFSNNNNVGKYDEDSLSHSFSSLSNPLNKLSRKGSNLPKNLAVSDYDSDEMYDQSTFKSPSPKKLPVTSGYDSLSNSYSIGDAEFNTTPQFDQPSQYNFSSDFDKYDDPSKQDRGAQKVERKTKIVRQPSTNMGASEKDRKKSFVFDLDDEEGSPNEESKKKFNLDQYVNASEDSYSRNTSTKSSKNKDENTNEEYTSSNFAFDVPPDVYIKDERNFIDSDEDNHHYKDSFDSNDKDSFDKNPNQASRSIKDSFDKNPNQASRSIKDSFDKNPNQASRSIKDNFDLSDDQSNKEDELDVEEEEEDETQSKLSYSHECGDEEKLSYYDESGYYTDNYYSEPANNTSIKVSSNNNSSIEIEIESTNDSSIQIEINGQKDTDGQNVAPGNVQFPLQFKDEPTQEDEDQDEAKPKSHGNRNQKTGEKTQNKLKNDEDEEEAKPKYHGDRKQKTGEKTQNKQKNNEDEEDVKPKSHGDKKQKTGEKTQNKLKNDEDEEEAKPKSDKNRKQKTSEKTQNKQKNNEDEDEANPKFDKNRKQKTSEKTQNKQKNNEDNDQPKSDDQKSGPSDQKPGKVKIQKKSSKPTIQTRNLSQPPKPSNYENIDSPPIHSSEASESGRGFSFTPHTPKLSIFTRDIFNVYNGEDSEYDDEEESDSTDKGKSKSDKGLSKKKKRGNDRPLKDDEDTKKIDRFTNSKLPLIGKEREWIFPIKFDMEPDLTKFKKIYEKYSPSILYDQMEREKSLQSRNSTPRGKR